MPCCPVCGKELTRKQRLGCSRAHANIASAKKRAVAVSRAAQRRGLNARPELVAESWA